MVYTALRGGDYCPEVKEKCFMADVANEPPAGPGIARFSKCNTEGVKVLTCNTPLPAKNQTACELTCVFAAMRGPLET